MKTSLYMGLDIGGTLAKVVCIAPERVMRKILTRYSSAIMIHDKYSADEHDIRPSDLAIVSDAEDRDLEFAMFSFSSRTISNLTDFLKELLIDYEDGDCFVLPVTGGGALKFKDELQSVCRRMELVKVDEIDAIAKGFSFLVTRPNSAFLFDSTSLIRTPVPIAEVNAPFPLLLVNIGSGVSMILIEGPDDYKRVQGSPIGGGTVLGLGKALFQAESFEEIMELSKRGDASHVDLSVGELIGASPDDEFWHYDTLASSLAKLNSIDISSVSRADLAQSIVRMVSYNIGYIAYLVSCLHDVNRIYFSGKYVNKHIPTMEAISYAVKFYENWKPPPTASGYNEPASPTTVPRACAGRKCDVRFLHQEGYVGAIGALLSFEKFS